jgi:hypothetical protein
MSDTNNDSRKTVRARKRRKRARKGSAVAGRYLLKRKNCFGMTEHVDLKSVEAAVENEERIVKELEQYLNDIAEAAVSRRFKKVPKKRKDSSQNIPKKTVQPRKNKK